MTTVEAVGLYKRYGERVAVEDLSFTAEAGEVLGLLGPNGAGKTTAIRLLSTILPPDRGTFSVAGVPAGQPTQIRRRIGVLPESAGYPRHQTGREYLRYHARLFGLPRADAERTADRLLGEVGLSDRATSRIHAYSRGMRQRLGIARALVNDPAVVFLDEPTLGLDPVGQRQVLDLIRDIAARRSATVLLCTHALSAAEDVCDRVLIFDRGRTVFAGTVAEALGGLGGDTGEHRPRTLTMRVVPADAERARAALAGTPGLRVQPPDGHIPDGHIEAIVVESSEADVSATALRAVLDAGVRLLAVDAGYPRLGEAFLAMTGGAMTEGEQP